MRTATHVSPSLRRLPRRTGALLAAAGLSGITALAALSGPAPAQAAQPEFRLPFECGSTWLTSTREDHSPSRSAVDFADGTAAGSPVLAPADGTVSVVRSQAGSYGKRVEIEHADGWSTVYAHLDSQTVEEGQKVRAGDRIGALGSTGDSDSAHLHFEMRHDGEIVEAGFVEADIPCPSDYDPDAPVTSENGCGDDQDSPAPTPGASPAVVVTNGGDVNRRSGPSIGHEVVGSLPHGARVRITCHARGTEVTSAFGTSNLWSRLEDGSWVSNAHLQTGSDDPVEEMCVWPPVRPLG